MLKGKIQPSQDFDPKGQANWLCDEQLSSSLEMNVQHLMQYHLIIMY